MLISQAWHLGADPGALCLILAWKLSSVALGPPDIAFSQFPCLFHAPGMTQLCWPQCHCSPPTADQNHLFRHFPLSFRSVSAIWMQHCWHSFMVQESLLAISLPSIPTGELPARLLGCSVHAQCPADGVTSSGFSDTAFIFNRELKARLDRREILVLLDPREQR